jgi:ubiquitin-conjugating enzyme E2 J1
MPAEYPFKPPAFVMLTPSGRFATDTKICLSISSFHPESWQPSWSVRSALIALIAFMQTSGDGAIGSIEVSTEIRRQMAVEARITPPKHANAERQELIKRMHAQMLDMEDRSRAIHKAVAGSPGSRMVELNEEQGEPAAEPNRDTAKNPASSSKGAAMGEPKEGEGMREPVPVSVPVPVPAAVAVPTPQNDAPSTTNPPHQRRIVSENWNWEDRGLAYLAVVLLLLLLAVIARRIFLAFNSQPRFASHSWSSTGIHFRDVGDL